MQDSNSPVASRRRFLKFLAGSPLLALCDPTGSLEALIGTASQKTTGWSADEPSTQKLITSPDQALNVFDLEAAARQTVPVDPEVPSDVRSPLGLDAERDAARADQALAAVALHEESDGGRIGQ